MANTTENLTPTNTPQAGNKPLLLLADTCFEMFAIRELRRPHLIIDELQAAFPDLNETEIRLAISMALTWRRILRAAGRPLH